MAVVHDFDLGLPGYASRHLSRIRYGFPDALPVRGDLGLSG
jgi:hypothetical protein